MGQACLGSRDVEQTSRMLFGLTSCAFGDNLALMIFVQEMLQGFVAQ